MGNSLGYTDPLYVKYAGAIYVLYPTEDPKVFTRQYMKHYTYAGEVRYDEQNKYFHPHGKGEFYTADHALHIKGNFVEGTFVDGEYFIRYETSCKFRRGSFDKDNLLHGRDCLYKDKDNFYIGEFYKGRPHIVKSYGIEGSLLEESTFDSNESRSGICTIYTLVFTDDRLTVYLAERGMYFNGELSYPIDAWYITPEDYRRLSIEVPVICADCKTQT
jgi:hypothetical protein